MEKGESAVLVIVLLFPELRKEVHLKSTGELRRRAEGEVHILPQHLRDVRLGDLHALRQLALIHAELLHPLKDPTEKCRTNVINAAHIVPVPVRSSCEKFKICAYATWR